MNAHIEAYHSIMESAICQRFEFENLEELKKTMSDFITRLTKEKDELTLKIGNLRDFIDTENFDGINEIQIGLMKIQHSAMKTYLNCLRERLLWLKAAEKK
jgi:hypothetical protein